MNDAQSTTCGTNISVIMGVTRSDLFGEYAQRSSNDLTESARVGRPTEPAS